MLSEIAGVIGISARVLRGTPEGARLAAESGAPPMRWTEPAAPAAPPPEAEGIGVYEGKAKEEL